MEIHTLVFDLMRAVNFSITQSSKIYMWQKIIWFVFLFFHSSIRSPPVLEREKKFYFVNF